MAGFGGVEFDTEKNGNTATSQKTTKGEVNCR